MRFTIWKFVYPLPQNEAEIEMPYGAEILCAREQNNPDAYQQVCIWARVDIDEQRRQKRTFKLCGTGHLAPFDFYIGTAVTASDFVWHIFEVRK